MCHVLQARRMQQSPGALPQHNHSTNPLSANSGSPVDAAIEIPDVPLHSDQCRNTAVASAGAAASSKEVEAGAPAAAGAAAGACISQMQSCNDAEAGSSAGDAEACQCCCTGRASPEQKSEVRMIRSRPIDSQMIRTVQGRFRPHIHAAFSCLLAATIS